MGSNNSRTGKIDVNPVVADGEKRPIDGKSADDASIRYAQDSSDAIGTCPR